MKQDPSTLEASRSLRGSAKHSASAPHKGHAASAASEFVVAKAERAAPAMLHQESTGIPIGEDGVIDRAFELHESDVAEETDAPAADSMQDESAGLAASDSQEPIVSAVHRRVMASSPHKDRSHLEITAPQPAAAALEQLNLSAAPPAPAAKEPSAMNVRHLIVAVLFTLLVVAITAIGTVYFMRYTLHLGGATEFASSGRERDSASAGLRTRAKERARAAQREDEPDLEESEPSEVPAASKGEAAERGNAAAMVAIPAGSFRMGSRDGARDERPQHVETVRAFFLDQHEVSVAEYDKCVAAGECRKQRSTHQSDNDRKFDRFCNFGRKNRDQHPMNCVDWYQARAYCRWAGKRLPTEVEWEYAARGNEGVTYPWGNEGPSERQLNACGRECAILGEQIGRQWSTMYSADDGWDATAPIGRFPRDRSPFGVLDMAGNVAEWTDTLYSRCYRDDCEPSSKERVIRGGAWNDDDARDVRATVRNRDLPLLRASFVGFRCARSAPAPSTSASHP